MMSFSKIQIAKIRLLSAHNSRFHTENILQKSEYLDICIFLREWRTTGSYIVVKVSHQRDKSTPSYYSGWFWLAQKFVEGRWERCKKTVFQNFEFRGVESKIYFSKMHGLQLPTHVETMNARLARPASSQQNIQNIIVRLGVTNSRGRMTKGGLLRTHGPPAPATDYQSWFVINQQIVQASELASSFFMYLRR